MVEANQAAVLISGAASGIGRATALKLAAEGARLGLFDLNAAALASVAADCEALGARAMSMPGDVSSDSDVAGAVAGLVERFGCLSAVVCAAGIALKGNVTTLTDEVWNKTLAVNLTGTFLMARHAMPHLIARSPSAFVAVSSDSGVRGSSGYAAYSASKHGVIGLVRCMALDHGPHGVRSNVVCPTFVDTPMADELLREGGRYDRAFYESRIPLGRFARADEVADAIRHLLSPQASYANGMVYVLDGGTTAGTFG
ncbi:SDR family NAD(P)-dependent oxidoreductase [Labrys monachus]|uniref:NAD(P)-dependent dehydrogenase (Short-subunit alcohol dehydrogenase family) n=1 Tax=Labrys monachus TaxID=217067 RepID=A0ABU0FBL5_9HYPH|nr:SDR family oxidoreductase [Labrys monachus]MDQ0391999.1 NAD(P)-dependent dehydrogenase (short-subunit alcohol dehydrogenase family) [Labrys monachus]